MSVSIPHSRLRVGYVGSVVWHKGIHVLIDALRGLDGVELIVYGDESVDPSYSRTLRESAAGLPVTFAGAFGRSALAGVYAGFDVLVVPSVWPENAPLVVQEAALYRLPVIASRIGGLPEFVRDGVNGRLVEPGSPSALRAALASLGADPDARARLGAGHPAVKSIVRDACDWERRYAAVIERRAAPEAEHVS